LYGEGSQRLVHFCALRIESTVKSDITVFRSCASCDSGNYAQKCSM